MGCFSSSESKSRGTSYLPAQADWLTKALGTYGPTLGQGENIFQGQRVAPFTGTQEAALGGLGDYLNIFSAQRDMPLFGEAGTSLSGILKGATGAEPLNAQQTSDFFRRVYEDPAKKRWSEDIRPLAREEFAGPGFWGSARAKAVTETGQDLSDWLGTQRGQLEWDVLRRNQELQEEKARRAQTGISQAMAYGQLPTQEAQQRLQGRGGVFDFAGAQQRQQQTEINAAIQKFAEENRITSKEDMDILMALLGLSYKSTTGMDSGAGLGYAMLANDAGGTISGAGSALKGIGSFLAG